MGLKSLSKAEFSIFSVTPPSSRIQTLRVEKLQETHNAVAETNNQQTPTVHLQRQRNMWHIHWAYTDRQELWSLKTRKWESPYEVCLHYRIWGPGQRCSTLFEAAYRELFLWKKVKYPHRGLIRQERQLSLLIETLWVCIYLLNVVLQSRAVVAIRWLFPETSRPWMAPAWNEKRHWVCKTQERMKTQTCLLVPSWKTFDWLTMLENDRSSFQIPPLESCQNKNNIIIRDWQ